MAQADCDYHHEIDKLVIGMIPVTENYNQNCCLIVHGNEWFTFRLTDFIISIRPDCIICKENIETDSDCISLKYFGCCSAECHYECLMTWHKYKLNQFYGKSSGDIYSCGNNKNVNFASMFKCPNCCRECALDDNTLNIFGGKEYVKQIAEEVKENYKPEKDELSEDLLRSIS